jgi:hypothetical protein
MALRQSTQFGAAIALFGLLSFVLAIVAELKKVIDSLASCLHYHVHMHRGAARA